MTPTTAPGASIQDADPRAIVTDLLMKYAHGVDRRDWNAVRSCYHDDAFDDHGEYKGDPDGLISWVTARHQTIPVSMHVIANVLIGAADQTGVTSEAYCIVHQRLLDNESFADLTMGVRYVDRYTCRGDAGWRIQHRVVVFDFQRIDPVNPIELPPTAVLGSRSNDDPAFGLAKA